MFIGTPHRLEGVSEEELSDRFTRILKLDFNNGTVVDEPFCSIKISTEDRLGVPLDHLQLPFMREEHGASILQIRRWLESVIHLYDGAQDVESLRVELMSKNLLLNQPHQSVTQQAAKASSGPQPSTPSYSNTESSPEQKSLEALLENFSVERRDPQIPCFMMDTYVRNKDFYGRQDVLSKLDDCLLPPNDPLTSSQPDQIRVGILCGMPGLGKTEIAIEYAFARKNDFDAVFWIRADDVSKLESDLAQIAIELEIQDPKEPDDKVTNKGLAIEWLCNPSKKDRGTGNQVRASWLVVFDNADEPDILAPYSDIANSGAVLITSRSPLSRTSFSQHAICIDVQTFNQEDSGLFVQKFSGIQGRLEEARQVGDRLGGLPLALAQMAGIIRLDFLSYPEFMRLYDAGDINEMEVQPSREPARGNVSTVLEKLSAAAQAILEISSFLDPDSIQEKILMNHATDVDMPSYPKKQVAFYNARKQLIGSSIFRHNQDTAEYWMHRVTRDVVRLRIEPERQRRVFLNAVTMVAAAWPIGEVEGHDVKLWETSKALYPHVISLEDAYRKHFKHGEYVDGDFEFAGLLNRAGWYQHERGESPIIKPLLELALDLCNRSKDIDHQDLESDIRHTLGAVASGTNDAASSMDHNKKVLEIRLGIAEKLGAVDEKLASAYNQMGISWMMAGEWTKGEECFATSAREYEKIPDYTKDKRSLALVNLGTTQWLQGDLARASEVLEMGLADREEIYGVMDNHCFRTGRFLHALGNVRFSQGRIKESEDFHRRALQQYQSTIRNRHHRTADVCHKMAQHCLRNGFFEDAIVFIDQALKNWSVDSETYAREIARTSYLKAKVLSEAGQEDEATKLLQKAAFIRHKITGVERDGKDLQEEDFDELVTFWSR
ncbi:hypothetical protein N7520_003985 [Penicillium odoratum]|uniref:uncharacterized protein n=1 Tax=Penicillium odoratum TaxID=1167516 RepID=UPI002546CA8C|nr:uncharacterized protein N7520_003985 [Penicillium odoratum]KAJ5769426.1 hypothetical protein N7520_003985 [Penicillium odoratum]